MAIKIRDIRVNLNDRELQGLIFDGALNKFVRGYDLKGVKAIDITLKSRIGRKIWGKKKQ